MNRFLNQFRRIYSDDGRNDADFTEQEAKLKASNQNMIAATVEMVRASERLNAAAMKVGFPVDKETMN